MRTFIAIELEPAIREVLVKLLRGLPRAPGVHWVTPDQLHVTLKFLGEVPDDRVAKVCAAAAAVSAQIEPFTIRVEGLGVFPAPRNPRVLWTGLADAQQCCRQWVKLADPVFHALGYPPEGRAYTPHITLGRSRSSDGAAVLRDVLEQTPAPRTAEMQVREIVVFESRLLPGGAEYHPLAKVRVGAS